VWSGDALLHEIRRASGAAGDPVVEERTYCHGPQVPVPIAQRTDRVVDGARVRGDWQFLVLDANDAPEAVVSAAGDLVAPIASDAWGRVEGAGRGATPFRAPGQYEDEETGLFYNRYRYYDPSTGQYISPDPLRLQGSLRGYAYVDNRPLTATDPYGLQTTTTINRTGGLPPITRSQSDNQPIHPAVQQALSPCTANTSGAPRVQPETAANPERGGRRPGTCAEPAALSAHLYDWEARNCPPQPPPRAGNASLQAAMREIDPENGISSRDPNGHPMAPCPNCSQTIPNLYHQAGMTAPPHVIAPGHPPQTIAALNRQGILPGNPSYPAPTQRFTPPQQSTPSYNDRLRDHNTLSGDNRVVHTWTPGGGWTSAPP
jgi:RHS repeat-associated protein